MYWDLVVATLAAVPVILFPVALMWDLNIGGVFAALKEATGRHVSSEQDVRVLARDK